MSRVKGGVQTEKGGQSSNGQEAWKLKVGRDSGSQPPQLGHGGSERGRGLPKATVHVGVRGGLLGLGSRPCRRVRRAREEERREERLTRVGRGAGGPEAGSEGGWELPWSNMGCVRTSSGGLGMTQGTQSADQTPSAPPRLQTSYPNLTEES